MDDDWRDRTRVFEISGRKRLSLAVSEVQRTAADETALSRVEEGLFEQAWIYGAAQGEVMASLMRALQRWGAIGGLYRNLQPVWHAASSTELEEVCSLLLFLEESLWRGGVYRRPACAF
ncbi:MAG TPA: hypothetical protein VFT91_07630, partial [Dehalococcoidia bacterium]|nr:hypothetical protein [Dehalococcoidia bacterium]